MSDTESTKTKKEKKSKEPKDSEDPKKDKKSKESEEPKTEKTEKAEKAEKAEKDETSKKTKKAKDSDSDNDSDADSESEASAKGSDNDADDKDEDKKKKKKKNPIEDLLEEFDGVVRKDEFNELTSMLGVYIAQKIHELYDTKAEHEPVGLSPDKFITWKNLVKAKGKAKTGKSDPKMPYMPAPDTRGLLAVTISLICRDFLLIVKNKKRDNKNMPTGDHNIIQYVTNELRTYKPDADEDSEFKSLPIIIPTLMDVMKANGAVPSDDGPYSPQELVHGIDRARELRGILKGSILAKTNDPRSALVQFILCFYKMIAGPLANNRWYGKVGTYNEAVFLSSLTQLTSVLKDQSGVIAFRSVLQQFLAQSAAEKEKKKKEKEKKDKKDKKKKKDKKGKKKKGKKDDSDDDSDESDDAESDDDDDKKKKKKKKDKKSKDKKSKDKKSKKSKEKSDDDADDDDQGGGSDADTDKGSDGDE